MDIRTSHYSEPTAVFEDTRGAAGWSFRSDPHSVMNCSTYGASGVGFTAEGTNHPHPGVPMHIHSSQNGCSSQPCPSSCSCHLDRVYQSESSHLRPPTIPFSPSFVHCRSPSHHEYSSSVTSSTWLESAQRHPPTSYICSSNNTGSSGMSHRDCPKCNWSVQMNGGAFSSHRYTDCPQPTYGPEYRTIGSSSSSFTTFGSHRYDSIQEFEHLPSHNSHSFLKTSSSLPFSSATPGKYHEIHAAAPEERTSVPWMSPPREQRGWRDLKPCAFGGRPNGVKSLRLSRKESKKGNNICRLCGKSYARPSTLKTHLRTHSGEKPYRCPNCNKAFSQTANLTAHMRTHSGEKPFRCFICHREFSQSSSVTTHMRTHSGERPYRCGFCRKAFADSSTLTKHLRIHSGEKPYQCSICFLRFSQSGNLTRHMKVHKSD